MSIRTVLVDDEPPAIERLSSLLESHPDFQIVGKFSSARQAARMLGKLAPAAVFIDIQMPQLSGFDVLAEAPSLKPAVVFVTAHSEFAVSAFEVEAVDYLLKPIVEERFDRALDRVREHVRSESRAPAAPGVRPYVQYLAARNGNRISLVNVSDIAWAEAAGNYVRLHVAGRSQLVRESLANLVTRLDPETFVRVHRSHVVNLHRVRHIESTFGKGYIVTLADGTRVTMSERYRDELFSRL